MKLKFTVLNMSCKHCQIRVESLLKEIPGISKAKANLTAKTAVVTAKSAISQQAITEKLNEFGYKAVFGDEQ